MAYPSITTTFAGPGNQGLQVGYNSGSIHVAAAERPETPPWPSCYVPFRRDPDFVARETLLDQIRERCSAPASRVALVGLGGVGKSQLAIEHCYRTVDQSPETWVFWAHASNTARLEQSYRDIADQIKAHGRKDPQADVFKLVHDWLRNEKNGPWLLVLDNADDAAVLSPPSNNSQGSQADSGGNGSGSALQQYLSTYLPPCKHGSVIVTSRTRRAALQIVEASDVIFIEPMHDKAAHALLHKKLGDKGEADDGIAELAKALDYMPLALVQAAAYIRERAPRCSVRQYLEKYQRSDRRKTSLLDQEAGHLRRDKAASNSILITWQISFDHIRIVRQSAADLLSFMSFFDRQGIHESLLHSLDSTYNKRDNGDKGREEDQIVPCSKEEDNHDCDSVSAVSTYVDGFDDDVVTLRDYSFITVTRDANTFEMHSLVQLATRKWLENEGQLDRWRKHFIFNLCAELPNGESENWQKCQALFPHARAALTHRPEDRESLKTWALLLYKAAWYVSKTGRANEAEQMSTKSMNAYIELFGKEHVATLRAMDMVGAARILGGKYTDAEYMYKQTRTQREKVFGPEHPETLESMSTLALVLDIQGRYEEAEVINRQTLALKERVLGPEHPQTLKNMSNLALVLDSQGRYEEAEVMNRQTLALNERVLGPEHPQTLTNMSNLALVLDSQGKYEAAEVMNRQTLALSERVLGPEHPDTLTSMSNLAGVLNRQGKYEEAEVMNKQTLTLREGVLGPEHPDTLISMSNLAALLDSKGKYEEAELINKQTLALSERILGPEHPDTLTSMSNLAGVLNRQGRYEEAEVINRQTLALKERVLGPEHPQTLTNMSNLALVLDSQGRYEEAEVMNRQTLALSERALGPEHPYTLTSMGNLALVLNSQGKYEEAEVMNRQTLALREKVLGPEHPDTLTSMGNLAGVLNMQGKYEEAEVINRQTLALRETVLGPEHPNTLESMHNLAVMLNYQGKYEEAEVMNRQTSALAGKVLGPEHPDTLTSIYGLAHVLAKRYRYDESLTLYKRVFAAYLIVLGKDHPTTHACRQHYSELLDRQERERHAEE